MGKIRDFKCYKSVGITSPGKEFVIKKSKNGGNT